MVNWPICMQVEGGGEGEDEGEEEDEGAAVLLPDQERGGCVGRRVQMEEVRPEGCQEQPSPQVYSHTHTRACPNSCYSTSYGMPHPNIIRVCARITVKCLRFR